MPEKLRSIFTTADEPKQETASCFIDTGVFFASYYERDSMHTEATLLMLSVALGWFGRAYTSTYVFDETLTITKSKINGNKAVELADYILKSTRIRILALGEIGDPDGKLSHELEDSFEKFKKHREMRGLSFTDCTSLALLEKTKIKCVLSFDDNFRSFVPKLLGIGYQANLSESENQILTKAARKLGIKL